MKWRFASVVAVSACATTAPVPPPRVVDVAPQTSAAPIAAPPSGPRPATRGDCEMIVDKNVETKLRENGIVDAQTIRERTSELRETLRGEIDRCVGRMTTDAAMACVKTAETSEKIDACLR